MLVCLYPLHKSAIEILNFCKLIDADESERIKIGNGKCSLLLRVEERNEIKRSLSTSLNGVILKIWKFEQISVGCFSLTFSNLQMTNWQTHQTELHIGSRTVSKAQTISNSYETKIGWSLMCVVHIYYY